MLEGVTFAIFLTALLAIVVFILYLLVEYGLGFIFFVLIIWAWILLTRN